MDHARLLFLLERASDGDFPASSGIPLGAQVAADRIFEQVVRDHRGIAVPEVVMRVKASLAGPDADRARAVRAGCGPEISQAVSSMRWVIGGRPPMSDSQPSTRSISSPRT